MPEEIKKKCICDKAAVLKQLTGTPELLTCSEINRIRLGLFTERNSDGTANLVLRGRDLFGRYNRRLSDVDVRALCLYLRKSPKRITELDLSYNNITDKGFFKLLKHVLIKGRSSLLSLNMMNNDLTELTLENLMKNASLMKLKHLRLNGNQFGTKGGEYLARFLMRNDTLEFCDMGDTGLTMTSVAPIVAALRIDYGKNTTLKSLNMSRIVPLFNRYQYESKWLAYHIELLLEKNSSVTVLHLQKNELVGHDIEYILRGLSNNHTLLYLDLGYNRIGEYAIELLAKYLSGKPQLRALNIAGNSIKDIGAKALFLGLPYSQISYLDISNNKITDNGMVNLLKTLKKSEFMRVFNLWGNEIGTESCVLLHRLITCHVLLQDSIDVKIYEVDGVLYAAYYPNPADRSKHFYYNVLEYGYPQPIYHIKRNKVDDEIDCDL